MEPYSGFAFVYDKFMQETPYDKWTDYILEIWKKAEHMPKLVLDLACGTGSMTVRLAEKGYEMIGIDISEQMLAVAEEKSRGAGILYICQDMSEFELYGTVDSIVCMCDSVNYLTEETEIVNLFKLVKNYLNPGGYFIFDINTEYRFKNVLADNVYSAVLEDAAYIWENCYYEDEGVNEYNAAFFTKTESGLYRRYDECHVEKAYSIEKIKNYVESAGLEIAGIYDELSFDYPNEKSERIFFVVTAI